MNGCLGQCHLNQEFGAVILTEQGWVCVIGYHQEFTRAQAPWLGVGVPPLWSQAVPWPSLPCLLLPRTPTVAGRGRGGVRPSERVS